MCDRLASSPDLVLSDVILPDGNRPDLVGAIRSRWPGVRVLLMSGYVGEMLDAHGLDSCAAAFIEKPFSPDSLVHAIDAALGTS